MNSPNALGSSRARLICELCLGHGHVVTLRWNWWKLAVNKVCGKDKSRIARAIEGSPLNGAFYLLHFLTGTFGGDGISAQPSTIASELGRNLNYVSPVVNEPAHYELHVREGHSASANYAAFQTYQTFCNHGHGHGHGYEQTEHGKEECSACNPDGETLRERTGRDEMERYETFGYALAMRVLQSDLYAQLDDKQKSECDELIKRGMSTAPNCGACPGDSSLCKTTCRLAEESPPIAPQVQAPDDNIEAMLDRDEETPRAARPPLEWERKQAEHAYIIGAFDYERHPIGSREWTLYWAGWLARSTAAAPAAANVQGGA